eukprot:3698214-Rhodomonas_salina.1
MEGGSVSGIWSVETERDWERERERGLGTERDWDTGIERDRDGTTGFDAPLTRALRAGWVGADQHRDRGALGRVSVDGGDGEAIACR